MKNLQAWSPLLINFKKETEKLFDLGCQAIEKWPDDLSNWYVNSFDKLIENAKKFNKDYKYEVTTLLCELIRSDYALNFMAGSKNLLKNPLEIWSIHEKVRFVRDSYESIYQNFAFITFISDYNKSDVENYRSDWYYPHKSKDGIRHGENSDDNWAYAGNHVTGKQYILSTSRIFSWLSADQKKLLKNVRNSDSHYKTIIIDDSVFLLDGDKSVEITNDIDELSDYLLACHHIMYELYVILLSKEKFWILPSVLLTLSEDFGYNKKEVAYGLLQHVFERMQKKEAKDKSANGKSKLGDDPKKLILFYGFIMHGALIGLWDILEDSKDDINELLQPTGKEFSTDKLRNLQKEAILEVINFFRMSSAKIEQFIDKKEVVEYTELEMQNYESIDLLEEIDNYTSSLKRALEAKDHGSMMLFTILPAGMAFITPLGKLYEKFQTVFTDIE